MKQFLSIFRFELSTYLKNKVFTGITLALVVGIGILLSFPRVSSLIQKEAPADTAQKKIMLYADNTAAVQEGIPAALQKETGSEIKLTDKSVEEMTVLVNAGEYDSAVSIVSPREYVYIVKNAELYDTTKDILDKIMLEQYQMETMISLGISPEASRELLTAPIESQLIQTGKDQMESFSYTYILIFALYIAIILYGQFVATGVATEKSSRAMELLITSAKPSNLMFGKIFGAGVAGLLQMSAVLGSSFLFFNLNKGYWGDNAVVNSIFNMPLSMLLYTILFFVLGFFLYAFLYGAVGSLATKVEEINTLVMPITMLFIVAFFIVMFSMSSGNVDSALMKAASFVPFTSPMAMFTRIAMGEVAAVEIIISVMILIVSVAGIGILSAKIYKVGVLLYGKPPKLWNIIKTIIKK